MNDSLDNCTPQVDDLGGYGELYYNVKIKLWLNAAPIMVAFGLLGNIAIVGILAIRVAKSANAIYLAALAITDCGVLICTIMLYVVENVVDYYNSAWLYGLWIGYLNVLFWLSNMFQVAAVYLTIATTMERWLGSINVRALNSWCTNTGAKISIFMVYVWAVSFSLPKYFEPEIVERNCTGLQRFRIQPSALLMNELYNTVYSVWLNNLCLIFVPFIVVLALNVYLSFRIGDRSRRREATTLVLVMSLVFLICALPAVLTTTLEVTAGSYLNRHRLVHMLLRDATNVMTTLNSAVNFYVYVCFGSQFRSECRNLILNRPNGAIQVIPSLVATPLGFRRTIMIRRSKRLSGSQSSDLRKSQIFSRRLISYRSTSQSPIPVQQNGCSSPVDYTVVPSRSSSMYFAAASVSWEKPTYV